MNIWWHKRAVFYVRLASWHKPRESVEKFESKLEEQEGNTRKNRKWMNLRLPPSVISQGFFYCSFNRASCKFISAKLFTLNRVTRLQIWHCNRHLGAFKNFKLRHWEDLWLESQWLSTLYILHHRMQMLWPLNFGGSVWSKSPLYSDSHFSSKSREKTWKTPTGQVNRMLHERNTISSRKVVLRPVIFPKIKGADWLMKSLH